MTARRFVVTATTVVAGLLASALTVSCADDGEPRSTSSPMVVITLPPGELDDLVVQPQDVPAGVVPLLAQTGPADVAEIAAFSADPASAQTALVERGFEAAYVATYADQQTQRSISSVVTRFATESGATADLTADLAASRGAGTSFEVSLGDQAGGVRGVLDTTTGTGELVTVRWRLGATTWLLAVAAPGEVDSDAVITLARKVLARARG